MKNLDRLIDRVIKPATQPARRPSTALALTPAQVVRVRSAPPSETLALALDAVHGGAHAVTLADGRVVGRQKPLPDYDEDLGAEILLRLLAVDMLLQRAPEANIRIWVMSLAASMESKKSQVALDAEVEVIIGQFDLPDCCFSRASQQAVIDACEGRDGKPGGWFPSYAKMKPIVAAFARPLHEEKRRLLELKALLDRRQKALAYDPTPKLPTDAEVLAWLETKEKQPPDFQRLVMAQAYRGRLQREAPALAAAYAERLDMLADPATLPPQAQVAPQGAPPVPQVTRGAVEAWVAAVAAEPASFARRVKLGEYQRWLAKADPDLALDFGPQLERLRDPRAIPRPASRAVPKAPVMTDAEARRFTEAQRALVDLSAVSRREKV
jgi:hypothetical protein